MTPLVWKSPTKAAEQPKQQIQEQRRRKLAFPDADETVQVPAADNDMVDLGITNEKTVLIENSHYKSLLVLARRNTLSDYIPVCRSYNGFDWEASPGHHVHIPIECGLDSGVRKCTILLTPADDDEYFITKYSHEISQRAEAVSYTHLTLPTIYSV